MRVGRGFVAILLLASLGACSGARSVPPSDAAKYGTKIPVSVTPSPTRSTSFVANTKDAWLEAADAICADLNNEFVALQGAPPQDEQALRAFLDKVIGLMQTFQKRLASIPGTYGKSGQAKVLVDLSGDVVADFTRAISALQAGDGQTVQSALAEGLVASERSTQIATGLGLTSCALPGG